MMKRFCWGLSFYKPQTTNDEKRQDSCYFFGTDEVTLLESSMPQASCLVLSINKKTKTSKATRLVTEGVRGCLEKPLNDYFVLQSRTMQMEGKRKRDFMKKNMSAKNRGLEAAIALFHRVRCPDTRALGSSRR